jgi:hypothetical protein
MLVLSNHLDYNCRPSIPIRRATNELLDGRGHGHNDPVQYRLGEHGDSATGEEMREERVQGGPDGLRLLLLLCTAWTAAATAGAARAGRAGDCWWKR